MASTNGGSGPERLGILGSGTIACGLAAAAAPHLDVTLWARSDASAARAQGTVRKACAKLDPAIEDGRVRVVTDLEALEDRTFVAEAVSEELDVKHELYSRLTERLAADALLATTTSSLSIARLAAASGRPDRFVGLHVFNPVVKMPLVELAFAQEASASTRQRALSLCELLGKRAIEVPDTPGFVVNRLLFPYLLDAARFADESGLAPEDVDACMTLGAGHPMGPLALLDFVGLDVSQAIGESLGVEIPAAVRERVAEGALGRKAGRGFYEYPERKSPAAA